MNRITKTRKVIQVLTVIFAIGLIVIIANFLIHTYRTKQSNTVVHEIDNQSTATDVLVEVGPRGLATDSWDKNQDVPEEVGVDTMKATIFEATVTNSSHATLEDWTLRIDITEDCYLNSSWTGDLEIHQFVAGEENVQTLDLREYQNETMVLKYYVGGSDLLIPLTAGDYIIYHPTAEDNEIDSTTELSGSATFGFIAYSTDGNFDFSRFILNYRLEKSIWDGTEARIFIVLAPTWFFIILMFLALSYITMRYERRLQMQGTITSEFLEVFADFVDAKEETMKGHSKGVAECARAIALKLGMSKNDAENVYYAALVHDIGKCYVPDYILKKQGDLSAEEYETVKTHAAKGAEMLKNCKSVPHAVEAALYHHERYDGTGYPTGKAGEEIPLIGRIICVADCYHVMSTGVVYKEKTSKERIIQELREQKGKQFDPMLADIMIEILEERDMETWEIK